MEESKGSELFSYAKNRLATVAHDLLQKTGVVPVPNHSNALFMIHKETGVEYVVKRGIHPTDLIAEALGWVLSRELAVRTPEALVVTGSQIGWASQLVDAGMPWDPVEAQLCNPTDIANVFVLDALVGNTDRHQDNVLVRDVGEGIPQEVVSIDLGNSRVGHAEGFAELGLEVAPDSQFLRGIERKAIELHAIVILERASLLSQDKARIAGLVYEASVATNIFRESESEIFVSSLQVRLENAEKLLSLYLDATLDGGPS